MIKQIENLLDPRTSDEIKNIFLGSSFPWYLDNKGVNYVGDNYFQFFHYFYINSYSTNSAKPNSFEGQTSPYIELVYPILKELNVLSLVSVKANLLTKTEKIVEHGMHSDFDDDKITTAVFYVNNNNGYTIFEDGNKVQSKENSVCIFPAPKLHSGSTCSDKNVRVVININYISQGNNL